MAELKFKRKKMIRFLISAIGLFLLGIMAGLIAWIIWYRSCDHTDRLLAQHRSLANIEEKLVSDSSGYREVAFKLTDQRGQVTRGELRFPAGTKRPLPALLILGGHGTGARAADLIDLEEPAVICAMDYPPYPERKIRFLEAPHLIHTLDSSAVAAVGMAQNVLDYLFAKPEVDTSRVTVIGASFGVPFAVIAAALDHRPKGLVLLYGSADLEKLIDWNLRRKIRCWPLRKAASFILGTLTAPFEPLSYINRIYPRPLLMVNSRDDEKIPLPCVDLLYRQAREPKEIIWLNSSHIHPSNRNLIDSLTRIVSGWLKKNDLLWSEKS
jgi:hypothetical protein